MPDLLRPPMPGRHRGRPQSCRRNSRLTKRTKHRARAAKARHRVKSRAGSRQRRGSMSTSRQGDACIAMTRAAPLTSSFMRREPSAATASSSRLCAVGRCARCAHSSRRTSPCRYAAHSRRSRRPRRLPDIRNVALTPSLLTPDTKLILINDHESGLTSKRMETWIKHYLCCDHCTQISRSAGDRDTSSTWTIRVSSGQTWLSWTTK